MPNKNFDVLDNVSTHSRPSELRITDMRFCDIVDAPMHCTLMKLYTNQGLVGFGEIRDNGSKTYALMLKHILLEENPCEIDRIFRKIKQFGGFARQGGGVSGVEIALWDLAGKAYGVPVYQMLGGKFRDKIRIYCDTDLTGRHTGEEMGRALRARMEKGYTFLKMDLGISLLYDIPGTLSAPLGFVEEFGKRREALEAAKRNRDDNDAEYRRALYHNYEINNIAHPFTGIHITDKGLDILDEYTREVRAVIGYEIPLAIDHFGHLGLEDCIKLCKRLEKYNLAWAEDLIPWQLTEQYAILRRSTTTPVCTGEDIYLKENFRPLLEAGGVAVIHPDILTSGGILENKKIGDLAQDYGVAMAVHMAESPIACMACVHSVASTENFLAMEMHSVDVPWYDDIAVGLARPIVKDGYITVSDKPGLGIDELCDEVLAAHLHPDLPGMWEETESWDNDTGNHRLWS
ncbi:MAG: mandelate racemase/muconate lactonizing enzyme family protein [Oscillospiraceae bacterium]|nr:mandelate racemase/muconate lactonizing enzyme family protein [Oscillospiraceae bacterium]